MPTPPSLDAAAKAAARKKAASKPKAKRRSPEQMADARLKELVKAGIVLPKQKLRAFITGREQSRQTGPATFMGRDRALTALKPGARVSASGRVYYENRRNRSDRDPKRGL